MTIIPIIPPFGEDKRYVMITRKSSLHFSKEKEHKRKESSLSKTTMKIPSTTTNPQNNQSSHPNSLSTTTITSQTTFPYLSSTPSSYHEPTSVLDLGLSSSPTSPVADASDPVVTVIPAVSGVLQNNHIYEWNDEQVPVPHHPLPNSMSMEDLESMMMDFAEKDDYIPPFQTFSQFGPFGHQNLNLSDPFYPSPNAGLPSPDHSVLSLNQNQNDSSSSLDISKEFCRGNHSNLEFDCSQLDQLFQAAEFVDSNELELTQMLVSRLNQRLRSPVGKPLQRACFYFKEALQSLLNGLMKPNQTTPQSAIEKFQKIQAYKHFYDVSPIVMFSNFTANQALVEVVDRAMLVHVIDFDLGLGGHWASFMRTIVERSKVWGSPPLALRVTAVISEVSAIEAKLIRDHLNVFAREFNVRFHIEFLQLRAFALLSLDAIRFVDGEMISVHLSPSIFRHLGAVDTARFFDFLHLISPRIIVLVDREGWGNTAGATSFRQKFINGIEYYSTLFESLDASEIGNVNLVSRIEKFLLRHNIFDAVKAGRNCITPWRQLFSGAGMVAVPFSEATESQADCLLSQTAPRGFHVAKRQEEMLLCWQERELLATSAWRCS